MIGTVVLILVILGLVSLFLRFRLEPALSDKTILEVNFEQSYPEYVSDVSSPETLFYRQPRLQEVVGAIEQAGKDKRIKAIVAKVGASQMGMASVQELRDAVLAFRGSGKPAIAYGETFGEVSPGNGAYYLATAFDEIYIQDSGDIGLTGLIFESPFVRGTLEKMGITPRMDHRYEYKTAMNMFTEKAYTDDHREADTAVLTSQFNQMVKGIAERRKLSEEEVRGLFDRGPFYGKEAVDARLVDGLAYRDEVYDKLKKRFGKKATYLSLFKYYDAAGSPYEEGETIALIFGVGSVHRGKSSYDPLFNSTSMGSDTVAAAFRDAIEDPDVKAIVFRVNSPGGSYVASDTIWRETVRAQEAGKPVIVSMGDVAGSGGYFVAMAAEKIVAHPGTVTGSIGVLGGKMLTSEFWNKFGVSWDHVKSSANATMWTGTHDYSPTEAERFQTWLDRVYDDFVSKVAQGRHLPDEGVRKIAKGRIWTGQDAKALGLVDELGGFPTALNLARQAAGLAKDEPVNLKPFPKEKSIIERLIESLMKQGSDEDDLTNQTMVDVLERVQPLLKMAEQAGLIDGHKKPLSMHNPACQ